MSICYKQRHYVHFHRKVTIIFTLFTLLIISSTSLCIESVNQTKIKGQWVYSEDLNKGMKLITADNKVLTVVESWTPLTKTTTYNLEINNNHTYFVGKQGIFTHNMGDCDETWFTRLKRKFRIGKKPKAPSSIKHHELITSLTEEEGSVKIIARGGRSKPEDHMSDIVYFKIDRIKITDGVAESTAQRDILKVLNKVQDYATKSGYRVNLRVKPNQLDQKSLSALQGALEHIEYKELGLHGTHFLTISPK